MPGRETMAVSKADKGQIQSVLGFEAAKGRLAGLGGRPPVWDPSLASEDSDKPHSAVLVPEMLHLAPVHIQGQVFCSVFSSSSSPFGALAARPCRHCLALNDSPPLPRAGVDFPEVRTHSTSHCEGAWASWLLAHPPALCTGPGKSSCRYGWVGDSASTELEFFPLPQHLPQRLGRLIKFSGSAYELWQDRSPRRLEYRLSSPDYAQPNLAVLPEHHAHRTDLI